MNEQFDSTYKENQTLAESVRQTQGSDTQEMESIELQKNVMSNNDRRLKPIQNKQMEDNNNLNNSSDDDDAEQSQSVASTNNSSKADENSEVLEDVDAALDLLGGFGRHQKISFLLQTICMAFGSYALYPMGYYELQPKYECISFDHATNPAAKWYSCTNIDFCQELMFDVDPRNATGKVLAYNRLPKYKVIWEDDSSLLNWIEQFDLQCAPKNEWGMFGSLFFLGVVISSLFMPRLSDVYGRKWISLSGTIMHVFCSLVILVSSSLKLSLFMTFLLGFAMGGRVLVGYCWMSEHMREIDLPKVTGFMFFCDSFGILIATVYFKFVSKNWKYMFAAPQIFLVVGIVMLIKYRTDSPKYYYSKKDFARLRWSLTLIGRNNGVLTKDESFTKVFKIEMDMQNQYKGGMPASNKSENDTSLKSFFADPTNRNNSIIFMVMGIACNFIYYLINFYVKYLPGDLYTIQAFNSISESFSQLFPLFIAKYVSNKIGFSLSFFASGLGCFFVMMGEMYEINWLIPIAVLLSKGAISCGFCYLYFATVSYFESEYLGLAIGLTNVIGRSSNIASPMVAEQNRPVPMMSCMTFASLAFVLCFMLKTPKEAKEEKEGKEQFALNNDKQIQRGSVDSREPSSV